MPAPPSSTCSFINISVTQPYGPTLAPDRGILPTPERLPEPFGFETPIRESRVQYVGREVSPFVPPNQRGENRNPLGFVEYFEELEVFRNLTKNTLGLTP